MERETVLTRLLNGEESSNPTVDLLKKIILTSHLGWFRVNGLAPDKNYTLASYLFDDERIVFDFTRLSSEKLNQFNNWLIGPHRGEARLALLSGVATNDYRGFTAEVGLSWWGRITNLLFYRKRSYHWDLAPVAISLDYQLNGLELCQGKQGIVIGFNQFSVPPGRQKYQKPDPLQLDPLLNTKRVFITDDLVTKLLDTQLENINFESMITNPHPFSVTVDSYERRMEQMNENRESNRLNHRPSLISRFFSWIKGFWSLLESQFRPQPRVIQNNNSTLIFRDKNLNVFRNENNGELLVIEKRPELDTQVFCGGGAKIFAHTGAKRALEEAGIPSLNVAGSSAGAIMATLSYLGYRSDEIYKFFQGFKPEYLIHYDIDRTGLSDSSALKAGLDFMIINKINEIINKYQLNQSAEGRHFLINKVFKEGKITFKSLHNLKKFCPDCCLGLNLIVTATNKDRRETRYFSYKTQPDMEVSEAVKISASFPVVYKPTMLNGEAYNDGGILSNFPIESFRDNHSTLLESQNGNCLSMVAFQFDNGVERTLVDRFVDRVYRENFIWNWIYSLLTGVKDPVSAWEQDRIKLRLSATQVVVIDVANVSATQFDIDPTTQSMLFNNGYQAAMEYIQARFCQQKGHMDNDESLYSHFSCMDELIFYCCYRNRLDLFNQFANLGTLDPGFVNYLRDQYFTTEMDTMPASQETIHTTTAPFFTNSFSKILGRKSKAENSEHNIKIFQAIYPVFYKLSATMLKNSDDIELFKRTRHSFNLHKPLACLRQLQAIQGPRHVLLDIFISVLKNLSINELDVFCIKLNQILNLFSSEHELNNTGFYGQLNLSIEQVNHLLWVFEKGSTPEVLALCQSLRETEGSLKTTSVSHLRVINESEEDDDDDEIQVEGSLNCKSSYF